MEQELRKTDRRVLKTKRAIRNAFAQLLSQKPLNEITVKDLSAAADINRKTFYNYYRDIHQVVDEIENEIVSAFESAIQDVDVSSDLRKSYVVFSKLTAIISGDLEFYGHLFGMNNDAGLIAKIMGATVYKIEVPGKGDDSRAFGPYKNGESVYYMADNLMTFYQRGAGFLHTLSGSGSNQMATEQGFYGLVAILRANAGKNSLYRMSDALEIGESTTTGPAKGEGLAGKNAAVKSVAITSPGVTFDDISGQDNQPAIEALAAREIITGKSAATFAPDATMISTAAKEVWRRELASKGEIRTSRWTPFSLFKKP